MSKKLIPVIEFDAQYMNAEYYMEIRKVKAERFFIPKLNDYSFAIHKDLKYNKEWVISECSTGREFCRAAKKATIKEAVKNRLRNFTVDQIISAIKMYQNK